MPERITRKGLVKKLDKVVSLIIRERDKACVICGSREQLQCGHIFSRVNYSTRWDITKDGNCHCQCAKCNILHEYDAYPFYRWYKHNFGEKKLEKLHTRSKQRSKLSDDELNKLLSMLELKLSIVLNSDDDF